MPHVVAEELAMILRKQLKDHEAKFGVINIPQDAYQAMKIAPEDG